MFQRYNIEKMHINVFDTPGFFDSDECRNNENKKQIASQIGNKIDMFAYFMTAYNKRMDSNIQNVLTILQDWTMGMGQILYTQEYYFRYIVTGYTVYNIPYISHELHLVKIL